MIISIGRAFTLVELLIVMAILAVLLSVALPNYLHTRKTSQKAICINNLKKIDAAIDQWTAEHAISNGTQPTLQQEEEIYGYTNKGKPGCPAGGVYTIYPVGGVTQVRCSREDEGHTLTE